jgi:hypothetical protein
VPLAAVAPIPAAAAPNQPLLDNPGNVPVVVAPEGDPANVTVRQLVRVAVAGDRIRRVLEAKAQQRGVAFAEIEADALRYTSLRSYVTPQQIADRSLRWQPARELWRYLVYPLGRGNRHYVFRWSDPMPCLADLAAIARSALARAAQALRRPRALPPGPPSRFACSWDFLRAPHRT